MGIAQLHIPYDLLIIKLMSLVVTHCMYDVWEEICIEMKLLTRIQLNRIVLFLLVLCLNLTFHLL